MIVDRIENAVYLLKDGSPEKLADFGTPYRPSTNWPRVIGIVVAAVVIAVLLVLMIRRRVVRRAGAA